MKKLNPLYLIYILSFIVSHGVPGIIPLLPILRDHFQLNAAEVSNAMAYFSYAALIATPISGYLYKKISKTWFITILVGFYFIGAIGTISVDTYYNFLLFRIIQGIGSGGINILMTILPSEYFKGTDRAKIMGKAFAFCALGLTVLPALSGFLGHYSWKLSLVVLQIPSLITLVILALTDLTPKFDLPQNKINFHEVKVILISPEAIALFVAIFFIGGIDMSMPSLFSLYSNQIFNFSTATIGIIYAIGNIGMTIGATYILGKMLKSTNFPYLYLGYGIINIAIFVWYTSFPAYSFIGIFFIYFTLSGLVIPFINYSISTIMPSSIIIVGLTLSMTLFRGGQGFLTAFFADIKVSYGFQIAFWTIGACYAFVIFIIFLYLKVLRYRFECRSCD